MPSSPPKPLTENAGLAFRGETAWRAAQLTPRQAKSFAEARNPTGRPNTDVLRELIGFESGRIKEQTQVDFPSHFTEQEAALYVKPASHLRRHSGKENPLTWWLNPHTNPDLRRALARLERFLATPVAAENPAWDWIESQRLPDATLCVVARDDDFAQGVLQSRLFKTWWRRHTAQLSPAEIVTAFPFPWPPATLFSALTRAQEEHRLAIARAARAGTQDSLDAAIAAAYHFPPDLSDDDTVKHLDAAHRNRATP